MNRVMKWILVGLLLAIFGSGCTIIRYVDGDDDDDGPTLPPKVVDMLVVVDLDHRTANLTDDFGGIIGTLGGELAKKNIEVRQAALAPMYGRSEGVVPLLYGENDDASEFGGFTDAVAFYTHDDGAQYLQDDAAYDGENLATLGADLDERAIYRPTTADPNARAYFVEPADGFVVIYLSASPRICGANDSDCAVDGQNPADYFTQAADGDAAWLQLPGGMGLPASKIFHGAIVTGEGMNYDAFYERCMAYPNFPATTLDVMEPSEHAYFGPFIEGVQGNGGRGAMVDLCEVMSSRRANSLQGLASKIRAIF